MSQLPHFIASSYIPVYGFFINRMTTNQVECFTKNVFIIVQSEAKNSHTYRIF